MHELSAFGQVLALVFLVALTFIFLALKIKYSFGEYETMLAEELCVAQEDYEELAEKEAFIYDTQLKQNTRLSEISGLYEITKEMSTSLRFGDIFEILAGYLHKNFLFKKLTFIIIKNANTSPGDMVYEAAGMEDGTLKARGIIPKLEIASRPLGGCDIALCGLLRKEPKRIEVLEGKRPSGAEYLPEGTRTFMAVPIIDDNMLIGVLAVENLSVSDMDKFPILAAQFTLEMRRIILYEKVEEMAITDGLTKAFAKRHIMERLGEEFDRSVRHNFSLSFLMVDIDHFKSYNDTYGHLVGDVVLKDIVTLLKANTREVDLIGRFGGEEFCAILPETRKEEARLVAERIREIIEKHEFRAYDESTNVKVSIGVAVYPGDASFVAELVDNADKALYRAKREGRNRVCVYS